MKLLTLVMAALLAFSCSTIQKSQINSSVNVTIDSPMEAKIDVDLTRKLTGYASGGYLFHLFKVSGDNKYLDGVSYNGSGASDNFLSSVLSKIGKVSEVRAAAAYNAIRTSDADVLVNPQYVVEESHWNPFYKQIKVKVVGNPGRIVAIKNKR